MAEEKKIREISVKELMDKVAKAEQKSTENDKNSNGEGYSSYLNSSNGNPDNRRVLSQRQ